MKKVIIMAAIAVLLVGISGSTGYFIATQMHKDNPTTTTVATNSNNAETIAFVNMDDGVEVNGELMNYASSLIDTSSDIYEITSLQEAKNGIEDGTYAAYIIIPATFSENAVSLNTKPVKSTIQYEVSQKLSEDAKETALYNIFNFENTLNYDLSYMYLSSILSEFHTAQGNAQDVIDNDNSDLQILLSISNMDLVTTINIGELKKYESEISNLDLSSNYEENEYLISLVQAKYDEYISLGSEDFNQLILEGETVYDYSALSELLGSLWTYTDSDGNAVYATGLSHVDSLIESYKSEVVEEFYSTINSIDTYTGYSEYNSGSILSGSILDLYLNGKAEAMEYSATYLQDRLDFNTTLDTLRGDIVTALTDNIKHPLQRVNVDLQKKPGTGIVAGYEDLQINELYDYLEIENALIIYMNSIYSPSTTTGAFLDSLAGSYGYAPTGSSTEWQVFYDYYLNTSLLGSSISSYIDDLLDYIEGKYETYLTTDTDESDTLTVNIDTIVNKVFAKEMDDDLDGQTVQKSIYSQIESFLNKDATIGIDYLTTLQTDDDTIVTNDEVLLEKLKGISESMNTLSTSISGDTDTLKIATTGEINSNIIDALISSSSSDATTFSTAYTEKTSAISAYMENFKLYDPLAYVNQSEISSISSDLSNNNNEIENLWSNLISEYIEYASKSNETASENVSTLTQTIYDANEESNETLSAGLQSAKSSRQSTNKENLQLMKDFISKLSYTKLGSGPSAEAYDFIIDPLIYNTDRIDTADLTETQSNNATQSNSNNISLELIIIICSIALALIIVISFVAYGLYKIKKTKEST